MGEIVGAFFGCEVFEDFGDSVPQRVTGSLGGFAQERLEFGESKFDGVEVGGVWRQKDQPGASGIDGFTHTLDLVALQVVEDHHVAFVQDWSQHGFGIEEESLAVHRPLQHKGRHQSIGAQAAGKRRGVPVAPRGLADQPPAAPAPAMAACHLGVGSGLIDEHQFPGIEARLARFPALPGLGHVGPVLLGRVQGFF